MLIEVGSVQRQTIEVELPDGTNSVKTMIPNPLYSYTFHPLPGKDIFVSPKPGVQDMKTETERGNYLGRTGKQHSVIRQIEPLRRKAKTRRLHRSWT